VRRFLISSVINALNAASHLVSVFTTLTTRICGEKNHTRMSLSYATAITKKLKELNMTNLKWSW